MRKEGRGKREKGKGKRKEGKAKAYLWLVLAAVAVAVVMVGRVILNAPQPQLNETALEDSSGARGTARPTTTTPVGGVVPNAPQSQEDEVSSSDDSEPESDEPQTEEEKREAEEEKLVEAFDDLTDKWQESSSKGVTMSDIDNFAKTFRSVPKNRQDECINRALNLIPDENVMLLAGVLMDKSMDREIVETVYNDVLNRDEDVKKPILQQIFKDKTHPCWADTAWILDVTDDLPKAK